MTRILITNDDGIDSPVLLPMAKALVERLDDVQVSVVVPDRQRSGVGHAFTFHDSLYYTAMDSEDYQGVDFYTTNGTPSDCVKFALCKLIPNGLQEVDLVISGVNDQLNTGVAVYYSGTVAGAREAALLGIPGLAVSAVDLSPANLQFSIDWLVDFIDQGMHLEIPNRKYWNVNLPDLNIGPVLGNRIAKMGTLMYEDYYYPTKLRNQLLGQGINTQVDPFHQQPAAKNADDALNAEQAADIAAEVPKAGEHYFLKGEKPPSELKRGTDDFDQANGYVSITPLTLDMGDESEFQRLSSLGDKLNSLKTTKP